MLRNRVVVFLFSLLLPWSAWAADLGVHKPSPPPITSLTWTGFYVGANVAYHWGTVTQSGCVGLCAVDPKLQGAYLAPQVGYDYQFSNGFVLGAFAEAPVTRLYATYTLAPGVVFKLRSEWAAVLAVRAGYAFGDFLPYVFAGPEFASSRVKSSASPIPVVNASYTGYALGLGLEYRLLRNVSIDLRYMYASLPKHTYDFGGGAEHYGEHASTGSIGVNWRF